MVEAYLCWVAAALSLAVVAIVVAEAMGEMFDLTEAQR
jgi:hypothetical protein